MRKLSSNQCKTLSASLLIATIVLVSCKKLIEIPGNPPTQILRQQQFLDSATALSAVAGVYSYSTRGFPYSDASLTLSTAMSAHEIAIVSSVGDMGQFYNYTLTSLNSTISPLWRNTYRGVYQINDVLAAINDNDKLSASFVKQITGEMEFTRAFCYFNLVNLFGDVPLVTSTDYVVNAQLPRASIAEIYSQILKDLDNAIKKLPIDYPSVGHARPNLYTALTLKAKVHLYRSQWQAAYDAADEVIKSNMYTLELDLDKVFLNGSPEAIWQLPVLNSSFRTEEAYNFVPNAPGITPAYIITESLLNQFETGDQRFTSWVGSSNTSTSTVYYPYKYKNFFPDPTVDYMIFRLAEVYLIRAEAAAQLGNLTDALDDVNVIRDRADLDPSLADVTSKTEVLAAIRQERQLELSFEWGNKWFDLKRTSNDTNYPANGQIGFALPGYKNRDAVYPLPKRELQLNKRLSQNPDYN